MKKKARKTKAAKRSPKAGAGPGAVSSAPRGTRISGNLTTKRQTPDVSFGGGSGGEAVPK